VVTAVKTCGFSDWKLELYVYSPFGAVMLYKVCSRCKT